MSEALELTVECVDLNNKLIIFETLKRRRSGIYLAVVISAFLARHLAKILMGVNPSSRVWNFTRPTTYHLIKSQHGCCWCCRHPRHALRGYCGTPSPWHAKISRFLWPNCKSG